MIGNFIVNDGGFMKGKIVGSVTLTEMRLAAVFFFMVGFWTLMASHQESSWPCLLPTFKQWVLGIVYSGIKPVFSYCRRSR